MSDNPRLSHDIRQAHDGRKNLRARRAEAPATLGMGLTQWVESNVEKPAAQLAAVRPAWEALVPAKVGAVLVGYKGGVLRVLVGSAVARYELDRLLAGGLLRQLQQQTKGLLFKVKIEINPGDGSGPGAAR